ncbi:MAG: hypothetical protein ABIR67_06730 [Gaiellaceae bacterium]
MIVADPWYDYFALPIAPFVLILQLGALFPPRWWARIGGALACAGAIQWMEWFVSNSHLEPDERANIGAGIMLFWSVLSLMRLGAAALGEVARVIVRQAGLLQDRS